MSRVSLVLIIACLLIGSKEISAQSSDTLIHIEAQPANGFHFPCLLFIPAGCSPLFDVTLLVEPNNSGTTSDDFEVHLQAAREQVGIGSLAHYLSSQLRMPLLMPVFPRPAKEWRLSTHMLDRDVMKIKKGKLKRIDLQLLAMINAAREKLFQLGYVSDQRVLMNGFSSSGVFANRFATLHPLWVKGYAAGGVNGLLMMPYDKLSNKKLNYPLGTADYEKIKGEEFDLAAFRKVAQFIYMNEFDTNDAVQHHDAFSAKERRIIHLLFGEQMMPDRWLQTQEQYRAVGVDVQFKTYEGIRHKVTSTVVDDLLTFFRVVLARS